MEGLSGGKLALFALCAAIRLSAQPATPASQKALIDRYCVVCHSSNAKVGGVVLEGLDLFRIPANTEIFEKVARKVRTGEMPPAGMPRPDRATGDQLATWITGAIDRYAAAHPNPGSPTIHRLNRAEYSNAIRDLLAVDTQAGAMLPVDDSGFGFDNIGEVLTVSPALLERYLTAARRVSRLAVGDAPLKPTEEEFTARALGFRGGRNERASDVLPFDTRGGIAFRYYFPADAEYRFRVRIGGESASNATPYDVKLMVKAGLRTVGVTFARDSTKPEIALVGGRRGGPAVAAAPMDLRLDGERVKRFTVAEGGPMPQIDKLILDGPFEATGRGDTPSRAKIFVCRPASAQEESPCAHTVLANLAHRAFRRPVTEADVAPLVAFYKSARAENDFDTSIERALRALLVSPDFLYRIERDPRGKAPSTVYTVGDIELASRLSFFIWSSIPDDALLSLAEKGRLHEPAVLAGEVHRMLDDPKSAALVENFAAQWLALRNIALAKPDPDAFPEFDESLRQSFLAETNLLVEHVLREDRPITEVLDANYTFVNERLAAHYGIPNVYGSQFRQVALTDPNRGGLLGQGSILTVTSYPNRTSVVQRGKWILENLLGAPPPPPPPNVPDLKPQGKDGRQLTMREAMEQHRADATCRSCHSRMDPLGFALENYDGVGKWRAKDAGAAIDASGKLPDGTVFEGPGGLKKAMLESHREEFLATVTAKLLTYALGRGLESSDLPAVRAIDRQAAKDEYRFSALVAAIVGSTPFQLRRIGEP